MICTFKGVEQEGWWFSSFYHKDVPAHTAGGWCSVVDAGLADRAHLDAFSRERAASMIPLRDDSRRSREWPLSSQLTHFFHKHLKIAD
jgi:hypothetical protein